MSKRDSIDGASGVAKMAETANVRLECGVFVWGVLA